MSTESVEFRRVAIRPIDCLRESKSLIGDQYWLLLGIVIVGFMIGSAGPFGILWGPMLCGIYDCYLRRMRGGTVEFGMLFKGFDHFVESMLATFMIVGATMIVTLPMSCLFFLVFSVTMAAVEPGNGELTALVPLLTGMGILYVVFGMFSILISTLTMFVYPLIVDRGLRAWPALTTSVRAAWANLGGMFALALLLMFILTMSLMCCYFPALLFLPFQYGAMAIAYRRVFPDESSPFAESPHPAHEVGV